MWNPLRRPSPEADRGPAPEGAPEQEETETPELNPDEIQARYNTLKLENDTLSDEEKLSDEVLWQRSVFELRYTQIGAELDQEAERLTQESRWQKFFKTKAGRLINNVLTVGAGVATNVTIRSALSGFVGFGWAAAVASGITGGAIGAFRTGKRAEQKLYQAEKIGQDLNLAALDEVTVMTGEGNIELTDEELAEIHKAISAIDSLIERGKLFGSKEDINNLLQKRNYYQAFLETKRTIDALPSEPIPEDQIPAKMAEAFLAAQKAHLEGSDLDIVNRGNVAALEFLKEKSKQVNWARVKGGLIGAGMGAAVSGIMTHFFHPATGFGGGEIDPQKAAENALGNEKFREAAEKLAHGLTESDPSSLASLAEGKKMLIENHLNYNENMASTLQDILNRANEAAQASGANTIFNAQGHLDDTVLRAIYEGMSYPDQLAQVAGTANLEQLADPNWVHHLSPVAKEVTEQWHQFAGATLAVSNYLAAPAAAEAGFLAPAIAATREALGQRQDKANLEIEYQADNKDQFVERIKALEGKFIVADDGTVYQIQKITSGEDLTKAEEGEIKVKEVTLDADSRVEAADEWTLGYQKLPETKKYKILNNIEEVKRILE